MESGDRLNTNGFELFDEVVKIRLLEKRGYAVFLKQTRDQMLGSETNIEAGKLGNVLTRLSCSILGKHAIS